MILYAVSLLPGRSRESAFDILKPIYLAAYYTTLLLMVARVSVEI